MVIPLDAGDDLDLLAELTRSGNTDAQREDIVDRVIKVLGE